MYPHERSLVEKMKDKPFVLLGINSDPKEHIKKRMEEEKIVWPFFFDGGSTHGPIATAWGIRYWPTIYVLDHKGVVRYKDVRGEALSAAVEKLVKQVPATKPSATTRPSKQH